MNSIAVEVNVSTRVRLLRERHPRMSELELAKLMGIAPKHVRSALGATVADKPKSRIVSRGRLPVVSAQRRAGA